MSDIKQIREEYKKSTDKLFWEFKKKLDELTVNYLDKLDRIKDR